MSLHSFLDGVALAAGLAVGGGLGLVIGSSWSSSPLQRRHRDRQPAAGEPHAARTRSVRWVALVALAPGARRDRRACCCRSPTRSLGALLAVFAGLLPLHRRRRAAAGGAPQRSLALGRRRHPGRRRGHLRLLDLRRRGGRAVMARIDRGSAAARGRAGHPPAPGGGRRAGGGSAARSPRRSCTSACGRSDPRIGRATVFRTLEALVAAGVARRLELDGHVYGYVACRAGAPPPPRLPTDAAGSRRSARPTSRRSPSASAATSASGSTTRGSTSTACAPSCARRA